MRGSKCKSILSLGEIVVEFVPLRGKKLFGPCPKKLTEFR